VPTVVMRGDSDRLCGRKDNQKLIEMDPENWTAR
jgi:hypothetical protein